MKTKDELQEIYFESHTSYYFDDIIRVTDIDFSHLLLTKNQIKHENILIYDISYIYEFKTVEH